MRSTSFLSIAALAFCSAAGAQTITQGGTSYVWTGVPTTCNSVAGFNNFTATGTDTLFQHFWALCIDNTTAACVLNTPTSAAVPAPGFANVGTRTYINWQGRNVDVYESVAVNQVAAAAGIAVSRVRIVNNSGAPVRLNLYGYTDFDVYGLQNSCMGSATATGLLHTLTNASTPGDFVEVLGVGADGDTAAAYPSVRTLVVGGCVDFTVTPFSPGGVFGPADYTGCFQWKDRSIAPGQSFEAYIAMAHNFPIRSCPAATATTYGLPTGTANGFLIGSAPILGSILRYEVLAGASAANQPGTLFFGLSSISLPLSGLTVLNSLDLFAISVTLNANSYATGILPVPYLPAVCGATIHGQVFYLDPASPIGIPISATNGVSYTVGS